MRFRPDTAETGPAAALGPDPDLEAVGRVRAGDLSAFELLMRRYNERLFRIVRSILTDEDESEDVVQEAYVRAFRGLGGFEGRAKFSTWLTRIAVHEATARRAKRRRMALFDPIEGVPEAAAVEVPMEPERSELTGALSRAVDALPEELRTVFTLRCIQGLDTREAAECLEVSPENVRVRLHRARALLHSSLEQRIGEEAPRLHRFDGARCDRIVAGVLARLRG